MLRVCETKESKFHGKRGLNSLISSSSSNRSSSSFLFDLGPYLLCLSVQSVFWFFGDSKKGKIKLSHPLWCRLSLVLFKRRRRRFLWEDQMKKNSQRSEHFPFSSFSLRPTQHTDNDQLHKPFPSSLSSSSVSDVKKFYVLGRSEGKGARNGGRAR